MEEKRIRLINLLEVLCEEHPDVKVVSQEDLDAFEEMDLRKYYESGGKVRPDDPILLSERWTYRKCRKSGQEAEIRMFCFHHGGGNISFYRQWINLELFPERVEAVAVELPGRGMQRNARLFRDLRELVVSMAEAIQDLFWDKPFVFFGHSLGALVAFELARELRRREIALPDLLIVSARTAPHLSLSDQGKPELHALPNDEDFLREMQVWYQNPDLMKIIEIPHLKENAIRTLRADMELFETYVPCLPEDPLDVSMVAVAGKEDASCSVEAIAEWEKQCTGSFEFRMFQGGHFYWRPDANPLIEMLVDSCDRILSMKKSMGLR